MHPRDRLASVGLFGLAALAWSAVALLVTTRSPRGDVSVQLAGAGLVGLALGLTCVPLFWLAVYGRRRGIAYRGEWLRAARRGVWVGAVAALFVILRAQDAFSLPIAAFVLLMVAVVEVSLSLER